MSVVTTASLMLEELKRANQPQSVAVLVSRLNYFPGLTRTHKRSTVARALRRYRAKGLVSSKRNGGRFVLWSFNTSQPAKVQVSNPQPKGAARSNIMCRPDNMPTLCKAIDDTVAGMIAKKTEFSAFEVTKSLREEVNAGNNLIDSGETGTVYVNGNSVAKIDHEVVKEAVHDLFQRGEMTGYDRTFNGTHFIYAEEAVSADDSDDDEDSGDDASDDDGSSGTAYDGSSTV